MLPQKKHDAPWLRESQKRREPQHGVVSRSRRRRGLAPGRRLVETGHTTANGIVGTAQMTTEVPLDDLAIQHACRTQHEPVILVRSRTAKDVNEIDEHVLIETEEDEYARGAG